MSKARSAAFEPRSVVQSVLGRWVREAGADPKEAFPGRGQIGLPTDHL